MTEAKGEIVIYQAQDGSPRIDVTLVNDSLWLSQRLIADLFEKDPDTIGTHIKKVYAEGELEEQAAALMTKVAIAQSLSGDQAAGLFRVLTDYAYALDVLDKYDHQVLEIEATSTKQLFQITYESAMAAIHGLREKFGGSTLFAMRRTILFKAP